MATEAVLGSPHPALNRLELARPRRIARHPAAPWLAVGTVCIGAFMGQLDASIVSVALPALRADLRTSPASATLVSLSYLLTLVGLVAPVGAWSDRVGRKGVYVAGFVLFTLASAGCAAAPDLLVLCALRVLQAGGAALLQANSIALIRGTATGSQLGRALGLQAMAQALGLAAGPAVGGALLAAGSWRLIFLATVPMGLLGVVTGLVLLPRSRDLAPRGSPSLHRVLLRDERFRGGLALGLAGYVLLFAVMVTVPFWLTGTGQGSAAHAAILLTALPVGVAVAAPLGGQLAQRAARPTALAGLLLAVFAAAALAARPRAAGLVLVLVLIGIGLGLLTPANTTALMRPVAAPLAGAASGLINMTRGLGTALGAGLSALAVGAGGHPDRALALVVAALCLTAVAAATLAGRPGRPRGRMDT